MFLINAKIREKGVKRAFLEKQKEIPAVVYGGKDRNSLLISIPFVDFQKVYKGAGESSAIDLKVGTKNIDVLVKDVQFDPIRNTPIHVDFYEIQADKEVAIFVPIEFSGIAPAVKDGKGSLVKVIYEVEIEALPKDLPKILNVDVSRLVDIDSQILVKDINLPKGVSLITDEEEVVVSISSLQEESDTTSEPIDLSKIEVEKKGKKDDTTVEN